jgi:hypothetical protein
MLMNVSVFAMRRPVMKGRRPGEANSISDSSSDDAGNSCGNLLSLILYMCTVLVR